MLKTFLLEPTGEIFSVVRPTLELSYDETVQRWVDTVLLSFPLILLRPAVLIFLRVAASLLYHPPVSSSSSSSVDPLFMSFHSMLVLSLTAHTDTFSFEDVTGMKSYRGLVLRQMLALSLYS